MFTIERWWIWRQQLVMKTKADFMLERRLQAERRAGQGRGVQGGLSEK